MEIKKPKGYKSCRIVYDTNAILVINLDYTIFQYQVVLGDSIKEFEIKSETDTHIISEEII